MKKIVILLTCIGTLFIGACAYKGHNLPNPNVAPPDSAEMVLVRGVTTQQQVQQNFGLPDYVTRDQQHNEVWTYQRHATISARSSRSQSFTVILYSRSGFNNQASQSQVSDQLMITFDSNKTVIDYDISSSIFSAE
jgi:hypothetical protein